MIAAVVDQASKVDEGVLEGRLEGRLGGMSLPRQIVFLAVWPLAQQVLNYLVGFVDTAVAGRVSVPATNAIAIGGYMQWFMGLMFMAVGTGATALVARSVGAGDRALAERVLGQAVLLALGVGVLVTGMIWATAGPIGWVVGLRAEDGSLGLAETYLRVSSLTACFGAVLFVGGACLAGAGDTRSPFWIMLAVNGVNVALTLWLALEPWTFRWESAGLEVALPGLGWGVAGIAWGTAISWAAGGVLTVAVLLRGTHGLRLCRSCLRLEGGLSRRVLRLGLPNFWERAGQWVGNFAVLAVLGYHAVAGMVEGMQGAHIVAIRIEAMSFLPGLAFATAASTLTGQYLGAGSVAQAKRAAVGCWVMGGGMMGLMGVVFLAVPEWLTRLLTDEPVLIEMASPLVFYAGLIQFFFASYMVLSGAMRGAGDTRTPMVLTNVMTWLVRLPLVLLGAWWFEDKLLGVWAGLLTELFLRGVVFIVWFGRGKWAEVEV
ncbi:MAG: MATE family efflux transporter [Planctomycetota bacterium]